ncbi:uncharacterized protein [Drosophila virilis]|uniref:Uncharacterized protein n=1 Tax=Drosophila virilis TaxID=7244 RepID=B4LL85_DROVI|nr:uncharacterized protein LOC6627287 isoform X2 [Drosophila virilis]EDW60822.2 uncharacterized protein Dvir_GJ20651 [Drosophila virilis]
MPAKSVSAVQRISQTMRAYQRNYSGRTLLEKSYDAFGLSVKTSDRLSWPKREEGYAAVQLLRQNRNWTNFRQFGTNNVTQNHLINRRGSTPRRNNILAAKNACMRRGSMEKPEMNEKQEPIADVIAAESHEEANNEGQRELRTVRDAVFGAQEVNEDDQEKQREADADLLRRMTKHRPVYPESSLSKKVIAPYTTYRTHRNSWAEFRHRMIYGVLSPFWRGTHQR